MINFGTDHPSYTQCANFFLYRATFCGLPRYQMRYLRYLLATPNENECRGLKNMGRRVNYGQTPSRELLLCLWEH